MFVNLHDAAAAGWNADYRDTLRRLLLAGVDPVIANDQARAEVTARRGEAPDLLKHIHDQGGPLSGQAGPLVSRDQVERVHTSDGDA